MSNSGYDINFHAIVVGKAGDDFVRRVIEILRSFEVQIIVCDDIYTAAASMLKSAGNNRFILGRLEQLSREGGKFFELAGAKGCACCCLADVDFKSRRKELLAALEAGVLLAGECSELEDLISGILEENTIPAVNSQSRNFLRDDFLTTKAELDALLGGR